MSATLKNPICPRTRRNAPEGLRIAVFACDALYPSAVRGREALNRCHF